MGMRCPTCKKPVQAPKANEPMGTFPFCCERCKLIDLGRWLDGRYQVPVAHDDEGAHVGLEYAVETLAQRSARGHGCERVHHGRTARNQHGVIVLFTPSVRRGSLPSRASSVAPLPPCPGPAGRQLRRPRSSTA